MEFAFLAGTEQLGQLKLPNDLLQDIVEARGTSAAQRHRHATKCLQLHRVVFVEVKQTLYQAIQSRVVGGRSYMSLPMQGPVERID